MLEDLLTYCRGLAVPAHGRTRDLFNDRQDKLAAGLGDNAFHSFLAGLSACGCSAASHPGSPCCCCAPLACSPCGLVHSSRHNSPGDTKHASVPYMLGDLCKHSQTRPSSLRHPCTCHICEDILLYDACLLATVCILFCQIHSCRHAIRVCSKLNRKLLLLLICILDSVQGGIATFSNPVQGEHPPVVEKP